MRRKLLLISLLLAGCGETVAPEPERVRIEVTRLDLTEAGQWLAAFSITNDGSTTVFLPRCDEVLTGLEHWTGSEWVRLHFDACIAIRAQDPVVLEPGEAVHGNRVIPPSGRYRLHVRYTHQMGAEFDHVVATDPIDTQ